MSVTSDYILYIITVNVITKVRLKNTFLLTQLKFSKPSLLMDYDFISLCCLLSKKKQ